jgi:hypothetical protein
MTLNGFIRGIELHFIGTQDSRGNHQGKKISIKAIYLKASLIKQSFDIGVNRETFHGSSGDELKYLFSNRLFANSLGMSRRFRP